MDVKDRAALVREIRYELKNKPAAEDRSIEFDDDGLGFQAAMPRRRSRGQSEGYSAYMRRRGGGDAQTYDAAARWDFARAMNPNKNERRNTRRAGRDPGGYVGYTGQWANHFDYNTPRARGARRARK